MFSLFMPQINKNNSCSSFTIAKKNYDYDEDQYTVAMHQLSAGEDEGERKLTIKYKNHHRSDCNEILQIKIKIALLS